MRKISSNRVHLRFDNKNDIDPNESLLFLFFLHNILPRDITLFVYYIPAMRRCFLNCIFYARCHVFHREFSSYIGALTDA